VVVGLENGSMKGRIAAVEEGLNVIKPTGPLDA